MLTPFHVLNTLIENYKNEIKEFVFDLKTNDCNIGFITNTSDYFKEHFYIDAEDFIYWIDEFKNNYKKYMPCCEKITFIHCDENFNYVKKLFV